MLVVFRSSGCSFSGSWIERIAWSHRSGLSLSSHIRPLIHVQRRFCLTGTDCVLFAAFAQVTLSAICEPERKRTGTTHGFQSMKHGVFGAFPHLNSETYGNQTTG